MLERLSGDCFSSVKAFTSAVRPSNPHYAALRLDEGSMGFWERHATPGDAVMSRAELRAGIEGEFKCKITPAALTRVLGDADGVRREDVGRVVAALVKPFGPPPPAYR